MGCSAPSAQRPRRMGAGLRSEPIPTPARCASTACRGVAALQLRLPPRRTTISPSMPISGTRPSMRSRGGRRSPWGAVPGDLAGTGCVAPDGASAPGRVTPGRGVPQPLDRRRRRPGPFRKPGRVRGRVSVVLTPQVSAPADGVGERRDGAAMDHRRPHAEIIPDGHLRANAVGLCPCECLPRSLAKGGMLPLGSASRSMCPPALA